MAVDIFKHGIPTIWKDILWEKTKGIYRYI